ncbi:MAG: hypothetical protein DWQ07_09890 [Chloroflexi bacterium]|nr:MAG: hypothetical protein DWQ07_09890 [Chloroflexota bacterium]MBL1192976.1 hypothetical protein [Chloroflexota bacterium]NOH10268.1 hypothetical protein [Chloroflexota bacterium]
MSNATTLGKILRVVGIILLGLTAAFHLLGGIGTACVALGAENYDSMVGIAPFKWLYQFFVLATIAVAVYAIRCTIAFARSKEKSYRDALVILVIGAVLSGVHVVSSQILRGASMPNDARLYMNILTLVVFLVFNIPAIREAMALGLATGGGTAGTGLGVAAIIMGISTLTVQIWAGPTHTFGGVNFADVWHTQLALAGWGLILLGVGLVAWHMQRPRITTRKPTALKQV